jgi:hypothetical protein
MPRTFQLFSISHTTIILVDSTLIQGDLQHIDRSTTITNRDAFDIELESTVNQQLLPRTTSLGMTITFPPFSSNSSFDPSLGAISQPPPPLDTQENTQNFMLRSCVSSLVAIFEI